MFEFDLSAVVEHWPVWLVTVTLVVAAVIDGWMLKVPNWITFPMITCGWVYSTWCFGIEGLGWSLLGTAVGLGLLLPLYAIGGMGAGDVKLLAGVGAWVGAMATLYAFCLSAVVGGVIAMLMVLSRRAWRKHSRQFFSIANEVMTIRCPVQLSAIAAERKSSMLLLPYGIPIALGSIVYFAWAGMLLYTAPIVGAASLTVVESWRAASTLTGLPDMPVETLCIKRRACPGQCLVGTNVANAPGMLETTNKRFVPEIVRRFWPAERQSNAPVQRRLRARVQ